MPDAPPPENTPPPPQSTAESEPVEGQEDFTPEWKQSVEDRFAQIGESLRTFSARRTNGGHPATQRTQPSSAPSAGAAGAGQAGGAPPTAGAGTPPAGDTRTPRPTHWWYRNFGE